MKLDFYKFKTTLAFQKFKTSLHQLKNPSVEPSHVDCNELRLFQRVRPTSSHKKFTWKISRSALAQKLCDAHVTKNISEKLQRQFRFSDEAWVAQHPVPVNPMPHERPHLLLDHFTGTNSDRVYRLIRSKVNRKNQIIIWRSWHSGESFFSKSMKKTPLSICIDISCSCYLLGKIVL